MVSAFLGRFPFYIETQQGSPRGVYPLIFVGDCLGVKHVGWVILEPKWNLAKLFAVDAVVADNRLEKQDTATDNQ